MGLRFDRGCMEELSIEKVSDIARQCKDGLGRKSEILLSAFVKAEAAVVENPNAENLRAFDVAHKMLLEIQEDDVGGNEQLYGPDWSNYNETKTKSEVLRYLIDAGWQVKRQTFYNHCNDGKLRVNRQGIYSRRMVKKYAESYLVHASVGVKKDDHEINLATTKTQKEIARISTAEEHERFKLDILRGKYILRDDVYRELASRGVVLNNGLEYLFQAHLAEMIALVGGDQQKAPELLKFLQDKKDEQLNAFANMGEFRVALELKEPIEDGV